MPITRRPASPLSIGRHAGNDLVVADAMASRNHARIERRKDKYVLIDQSSNGTYVRFDSGEQFRLLREEMILHGSGTLSFGHAPDAQGAELVTFKIG